jgi:hypothetical protein
VERLIDSMLLRSQKTDQDDQRVSQRSTRDLAFFVDLAAEDAVGKL